MIRISLQDKEFTQGRDTTAQSKRIPGAQAGELNNGVEYQEQIVSFSDDAMKIDECLISCAPQTMEESRPASDFREHTIVDFLERPRVVATHIWSTADVRNTNLIDLEIPKALLDNMNLNKFDGFSSFSATVEFKLQINSQPFQAGLLIMGALPSRDLIGSRNSDVKIAIDKSLYIPHTLFDISKTSEITLSVPYVSPFPQYNLVLDPINWSNFFVKVYSPLVSKQTDQLDLVLWARFKDIKLGYPTVLPVRTPATNLILQSGETSGPVSKVAATIVDVAEGVGKGVSNYIPTVKPFVNGMTTVGRGIQSLLAAFGFSKPQKLDNQNQVVVRPGFNLANVDGVDAGVPMSAFAGNALPLMSSLGGSDADELSFKYLLQQPNYIDNFSYSSTLTAPTTIWSTYLCPFFLSKTEIQSHPQPTLLYYLSNFFLYWRGSLKFTFRFVKTNYHSGRLELVFCPFSQTQSSDIVNRSAYAYKVIMDLREQTEFSVVIPYVNTRNYSYCDMRINGAPIDATITNPNTVIAHASPGMIAINALTPLQLASELLPTSIDCVVEVSGGDDFELQAPINEGWVGFDSASTSQLTLQSGETFGSTGVRDSRVNTVDNKVIFQSVTGNNRSLDVDTSHAEHCMGERMVSMRPLLKRPSYAFTSTGNLFTYTDILQLNSIFTDDTGSYLVDFGVTAKDNPIACNLLSRIVQMYAFYRGGINIKVAPDKGQIVPNLYYAYISGLTTASNTYMSYPFSVEQYNAKSLCEFNYPYYNSFKFSAIPTHQTVPNVTQPFFNFIATGRVAISAKDDFDCGFFLGPPPSVFRPTLKTIS